MTDTLHVDKLTKAYGDLLALDDVSVKLAAGQRVALIGLNGSGKTTLLRTAAGLLEPTKGKVLVMGHKAGSIDARAAVSYIPDTPVLYDDLSVAEHLEYIARLHGNEEWQALADLLIERLGLGSRSEELPSTFSRGLRQKVSIALAFVRPFDLMLVDEPFVGLDQPGRLALLGLLDEAAEAGAAILVSTHQSDFLGQATRCIGMRDGRVVFDGKPSTKAQQEILGA